MTRTLAGEGTPTGYDDGISCLLLLVAGLVHLAPANVSADANETAVSSPNAASAASITDGGSHTCALLSNGQVNGWAHAHDDHRGTGHHVAGILRVAPLGQSRGVWVPFLEHRVGRSAMSRTFAIDPTHDVRSRGLEGRSVQVDPFSEFPSSGDPVVVHWNGDTGPT